MNLKNITDCVLGKFYQISEITESDEQNKIEFEKIGFVKNTLVSINRIAIANSLFELQINNSAWMIRKEDAQKIWVKEYTI